MRRLIAVLTICLIVASAIFLADRPGTISVDWQGWRIETSLATSLLILLVAMAVLWLVLTGVGALIGAPKRLSRRRREARLLQGYRSLTMGLVAVASGDAADAERHRERGDRSFRKSGLPLPPLARLLAAQAALLGGKESAARDEFSQMLQDPDLAFLGLRGLIVQDLKAGNDQAALEHIIRAKRIRPHSSWLLRSELALEARLQDWRQASDTLRDAVKQGAIASDSGRDYQKALLVARSSQAEKEQRFRDASTFAVQAYGLDKNFLPAVLRYATVQNRNGRRAKALSAIETAWRHEPHLDLAEAYLGMMSGETPALRFQQFESLLELRPEHNTAHLAGMAAALKAKLWGEARNYAKRAGAERPGPWPQPLCLMMIELEENDPTTDETLDTWRHRLKDAPSDPTWICSNCGAETSHWAVTCAHCEDFASLSWATPGSGVDRKVVLLNPLASPLEDPLLDASFFSTGIVRSATPAQERI